VLRNLQQRTVVDSPLLPADRRRAGPFAYGVRAVPVDLNDFRHELDLPTETATGSCVGLVSIQPRHPAAGRW